MGPVPQRSRLANRRGDAYLFSTYVASLMFVVVGAVGLQRTVMRTYSQFIEQAMSAWAAAPQSANAVLVYASAHPQ